MILAKNNRTLTEDDRRNIWYLYTVKKLPKEQIMKKLNWSRMTVYKVLNEPKPEMKALEEIADKQNQKLIDIIEHDDKLPQIILKILDAINDKALIKEYANNNGLKSLMTAFGVISDKNINVKKLDLERRKVVALEKQVELKQRELDMRLTTPEAFNGVTIINDVEQAKEYIKEYKELAEADVRYSD